MSDLKKNLKVTTDIPYIDEEVDESQLGLFDPDSPDIELFNLVDDELIKLSGSKIKYFKYQSDETFDEVYMEKRNKVIEVEPIVLYGHYDPAVIEQGLADFGIEAKNDQLFTFNQNYVQRKLGRPPIEGDILEPEFQKIKYRVIQRS